MTTWYLIAEWNELEARLNSLPLDYRIFIKQVLVLQKLLHAGTTTLPDGRDIGELLRDYLRIKENMESKYPYLKDGQEPPPRQAL